MGQAFSSIKKILPKTTSPPVSNTDLHRDPYRFGFPHHDTKKSDDKVEEKTVDEKVYDAGEKVTASAEKVTASAEKEIASAEKVTASAEKETVEESKDDMKPILTDEQKFHLINKSMNYEYTPYDFGVKKCKREETCKDNIASDSDEEPCIYQKAPCKKQKSPCINKKSPCAVEEEEEEEEEETVCPIPCKDVKMKVNEVCKKELKGVCATKVKTIPKAKPPPPVKAAVPPPCNKTPPPPKPKAPSVCPPTSAAAKDSKSPSGTKGGGMGQIGGKFIGDYPLEYNPKVHGPYDPARYYGKPDTHFGDVKLGELGSWFARRNKHPLAMVSAISRAHWRWQHRYIHPKRGTLVPYIQLVSACMVVSYIINYYKIKNHYHYKYH